MKLDTLQHRNGQACIIGLNTHVTHDSFCDESSVINNSQVFRSTLINTRLKDSISVDSSLIGLTLNDSIVDHVKVEGNIRLTEVVAENCELYGDWELSGNARIHERIWHRAPRFHRIKGMSTCVGHEVDAGITECVPGKALIACECKDIEGWLRIGPVVGKGLGWTEGQVTEAVEFLKSLL